MTEKSGKKNYRDNNDMDLTKNSLLEAANNMNTANLISTPLGMLPVPPDEKHDDKPGKDDDYDRLP